MSTSATSEFFAFFRAYARTGIHAVMAVIVTVGFGLGAISRVFPIVGVICYALVPFSLYAAGYEPNSTEEPAGTEESENTGDSEITGEPKNSDEPENTEQTGRTDRGTAENANSSTESERTERARPRDAGSTDDGRDRAATGTETETGRTDTEIGEHDAGTAGTEFESESDTGTERSGGEPERADSGADSTGATTENDERSAEREKSTDEAETRPEPTWNEADTPSGLALTDAALAGDTPLAVGESGAVLARHGESWERVLDGGPGGDGNALWAIETTADGERAWFAGDGGALGRYDLDAERHTDYSAPEDRTSTWSDLAVTGSAGEERLFLSTGSGEVVRGECEEDAIEWGDGTKPAGGSSIAAIDFEGGYGAFCDTNSVVAETTDDGTHYERIGVDADATPTDLFVLDSKSVFLTTTDGTIQRYDGERWTPRSTDADALAGIDGTEERIFAVGDAGALLAESGGDWRRASISTEADLAGVAVGSAHAIAVGENTIVEYGRG